MAGVVTAGVVEVGVRANIENYTRGMADARRLGDTFSSRITRSFRSVGVSVANLTRQARSLVGSFAGPAGLVGMAGAATIGLAKLTAEALDTTRRQTELANAITVTGNRSRVTADEIERVAREISLSSGRTVDDVRTVSMELVKTGVVGVNAFRDILAISSRLASSGFGTLEQNASRLATSLRDPRQALLELHQEGIEFTATQARTVRLLAESNRMFEAHRIILDNVRNQTQNVREVSQSLGNELLGAAEDIGKAIISSIVDLDWLNRKLGESAVSVRNWRDQVTGRADDARVRNLGLDQIRTNIEAIEKAITDLRSSGTIDDMNRAFLQLVVPKFNLDNILPMQALTLLRPELERYKRIMAELETAEQARAQRQSSRRASDEEIKRSLGLAPDHLAQFQRRLAFERETLGMTEAQTRAEEALLQLKERGVHLDARAQLGIRSQVVELERLKETISTIKEATTSVFDSMANALTDFAVTGKFKFKELADSIVRDLLRIALRAFVTNQIVAGITGMAGGLMGGGKVIGPSGIGTGGTTTVKPAGLLGFAEGGAFRVPGSGAQDRPTLVGLAPGELVTVTPKDRVTDTGGTKVTNQVIVNTSRDFEVQQNESQDQDGNRIIRTVLSEVKKEMAMGGFDPIMAGRFGSSPRLARR